MNTGFVCPIHHGCNAETTGRLWLRGCWVRAWFSGHIVQRFRYRILDFWGVVANCRGGVANAGNKKGLRLSGLSASLPSQLGIRQASGRTLAFMILGV